MTKQELTALSKESLQQIILDMQTFLSEKQRGRLEELAAAERRGDKSFSTEPAAVPEAFVRRMSQELVEEKMAQIKDWMQQIGEGELSLDTEGYEDYSAGYWNADWVTEYYDNQGIGNKIQFMICFAEDCVNDRRYEEAAFLYDWLWGMEVCAGGEMEEEPADLNLLAEEKIVHADLKKTALLTLYAEYQIQEPDKRAEALYR